MRLFEATFIFLTLPCLQAATVSTASSAWQAYPSGLEADSSSDPVHLITSANSLSSPSTPEEEMTGKMLLGIDTVSDSDAIAPPSNGDTAFFDPRLPD